MPVVESTSEPLKDFKRKILNLRYCAIARANEVQNSYLIMARLTESALVVTLSSLFYFTSFAST